MSRLSVLIITLNEERNIQRCLESVQEVADEIVVVDSYSTDRTEDICSKYNVRFITHKFEGYVEQRTWATTQASNDYILCLDADEALSHELKESIKQVKENWDADGYYINRKTNYCGKWIKHCGWYPDKKLRLLNRKKGKQVGINPHDRFEMDKGAIVHHLKGDLLHYSYYTISDHINQMQKFTDISARMKYERGKSISVFMILLRLFFSFFKKYFIKLGILDGYYGFVISILFVYTNFLKDIKLRELNKNSKKE